MKKQKNKKLSKIMKERYKNGKVSEKFKENILKKGHKTWNKGKRILLDINVIKKMYLDEKKSCLDIAKELGVTDTIIRNRLIESRVKLRSMKESKLTPLANAKMKPTQFKKGVIPHNKGKTKENYETQRINSYKRQRLDINNLKNYIIKSYTLDNKSQIEIAKELGCDFVVINRILKDNNIEIKPQSYYLKGRKSLLKDKTYEEYYGMEKAREIKSKIKEVRSKQIFPLVDSKPELKIQSFLTQLNIPFLTHQYMEIEHSYQCDILIPSINLVIEVDGDYWHGNPKVFPNPSEWQIKQIELDEIRTQELIEAGFNVIRLWECDIKIMELNDFMEII